MSARCIQTCATLYAPARLGYHFPRHLALALNTPPPPPNAAAAVAASPGGASLDDVSQRLNISYQLLFERNPLPMWVYDVQTLRMLAVNAAAAARYGYSKQEFVGLTLMDLHHGDDVTQFHEHLMLPPGEQLAQRLWRHRHRSGDVMEVELVTEDIELDGVHARMALVRDRTVQLHAHQARRELTRRLLSTLDSVTDGFVTLDRDWRFTYVNAQAERLLHKTREELLGCNVWEKFPEAVGSTFQVEYQRAMAEGSTASFETYFEPWGVWLTVVAYPSAQGLAVYFRDVTEKHMAVQLLLEEREALATVVNAISDAIISVDAQGQIKMFNAGAERIFRRTRQSMLGQNVDLLLPERLREAHQRHRQQLQPGAVASSRMMGLGVVKGLRSDGQELELEGTLSQVTQNQQPIWIINLRDVSERLRFAAEAQHSQAQLSELTHKLMGQEKMLVKQLAQVLHDQLGQTLAAVRMTHEAILAVQAVQASPAVERLRTQLSTLIGHAVRQVRQVLIDLRPPLLEEQGLAAALDNELRNRSLREPEIDISIDLPPEVALIRWPAEVEYAAFMVAREAVENALRHAGATTVSVRLAGSAVSLQLEVADDGVGIKAGALAPTGHLGLLGMHERARAIGAVVKVESEPAQGTRVRFNWQSENGWAPSI